MGLADVFGQFFGSWRRIHVTCGICIHVELLNRVINLQPYTVNSVWETFTYGTYTDEPH